MSEAPPFVSIIIPTYNRPESIAACLKGIAELDYPADRFETIVVDDGGSVPLDDVVRRAAPDVRVRIIRQQNAGPAAARNTGAHAASGELLAFTDDDCRPDEGWLSALGEAHRRSPEALLGGRTVNGLPDNYFSQASQDIATFAYEYFNGGGQGPRFFTSNNMAAPARLFAEVEGFDTSFPLAAGEDREFSDRWLASGLPFHYEPAAVMYHCHRLSARRFWRQHFNYGRGGYHFNVVRKAAGRGPVTREPLRFHLDLITYNLQRGDLRRGLGQLPIMTASQAAVAFGYLFEHVRRRLRPGT
jgi:GT2 family glycosyltransferase